MKKLLIFVLITSSILLVGCFNNETKNQVEENKLSSQTQTGSVEQVSQNGIISNSGVENNTGIIQLTTSGSFKNELDLCKIDNYGANDFLEGKDNLGNKLFSYKKYDKSFLNILSKPIENNGNKFFTLSYIDLNSTGATENVKDELYFIDCKNNKSSILHSTIGGYFGMKILGFNGNNMFLYEAVGDGRGWSFGTNYKIDIYTKKQADVFSYIKECNGIDIANNCGLGDVIFNNDFTKAIKYQDEETSFWKIDGLKTTKKSYLLITNILTKKTSIIDDGIIDYSYMDNQYQDFIKWINNNTIEITLKDKTKKNISVN